MKKILIAIFILIFSTSAYANNRLDGFNKWLFENGHTAYVEKIESDYQESIENGEEWAWVINYAFSVKPTKTEEGAPNERGEWVSAQFTSPRDEVWIEWYQIENGKLINWISAKSDPIKE